MREVLPFPLPFIIFVYPFWLFGPCLMQLQ